MFRFVLGYGSTSFRSSAKEFKDVTDANQTLVFQFSRLVGVNIGSEFAPDICRFLAEHHVPRPTIPIPQ